MKRLAWWAIGVGLLCMVLGIVEAKVPALREELDADATMDFIIALTQLGSLLFVGGALLLTGTVIADAITRAQGTREGP